GRVSQALPGAPGFAPSSLTRQTGAPFFAEQRAGFDDLSLSLLICGAPPLAARTPIRVLRAAQSLRAGSTQQGTISSVGPLTRLNFHHASLEGSPHRGNHCLLYTAVWSYSPCGPLTCS